ncbi:DUF2817 domain-containing protein [Acinetobacter soli]|uniref:DUF2817 domain-containing protein n=1 Tax=Acinetobacter soli TaxID=487316 RepID=UPI004056DC62
MADKPISYQQLVDMEKDADTWGEATHADKYTTVVSRLGRQYPSLAKALQTIIDAGGFKPYSTEVELKASVPVIVPSAAYAFDTQKVWLWNGSAWIDEGTSALDQSKQFTNFVNSKNLQIFYDFYTDQQVPDYFIITNDKKIAWSIENQSSYKLDFYNSNDLPDVLFLSSDFKILNTMSSINFDNLPISEFSSKDVYLDSRFVKQIRKTYPDFYFNPSQSVITHANDIYAFYDQMMTENPSYITKALLGNDSEGFPMYSYTFTPPTKLYWGGHTASSVAPPEIVITSGIHGAEKMGIIGAISFFMNLVNEWRREQHYDKLRFACKFTIYPACNPYGTRMNTRGNINGVDLNRNFDVDWANAGSSDPGDVNYKGSAPMSEIETQLIATIPDKHPNAMLFLDLHQQGEVYLLWFGTILEQTRGIVVDALDEVIMYVHKQIKPTGDPQSQMVRLAYNGEGTLARYFQIVKNKPTILIETSTASHPMLTGQWLHARMVAEHSILTVVRLMYEKELRKRAISHS